MKTIKRSISIVFIIFSISFYGCSGVPVNMDTQLPYNIDISKGRQIMARTAGFQLFLFFPININNRHEKAYQKLKKLAGENSCITDIKIQESWRYAFVGTVYITTIKATVYPMR